MRKKLLKLCSLIFLAAVCCLALFVGCSKDEETGVATTYSVTYTYEKLEGRPDTITMTYNATSGKEVTAPGLAVLGYEVDTQNGEYLGTGTVEEDGSLLLKVPYKLVESDVNVSECQNGSVALSVDGKTVTSAKFGQVVELKVNVNSGYILESVSVQKENGEFVPVSNDRFIMPESAVRVSLNIQGNEQTLYKVQHWVKSVSDDTYALFKEENGFFTTGQTVSANALANTGLQELTDHQDRNASGTVVADGSLVLTLYYVRRGFNVTKDTSVGINFNVDKESSVVYGDKVSVSITGDVAEGYESKVGVYKTGDETETMVWAEKKGTNYVFDMPEYSVTVKVIAVAKTNVAYTVEHWFENANDDSYSLASEEGCFGTTGVSATAQAKTATGFVFSEDVQNNVLNGVVQGDGSLVLKLFYKRVKYTVEFKDYKNELVSTGEYKYGSKLPASPTDNYYIKDLDNYFYWSVNGKLYDPDKVVTEKTTVLQKFYDGIIYTKEDFYKAFNAVDKNDGYGVISEDVATGAYILMDNIDFQGDVIELGGLSGLLEGNGYALKNINVGHNWMSDKINSNTRFVTLFREVSGIIRNVSFENVNYEFGTHIYEKSKRGVIGYAGLIIGNFSGTLENVYVQGSMRGLVYSQMSWNGSSYFQVPYDDAEGTPVAGAVIFNAEGGTLKNVIVDVASENRLGYNSTLSLLAGKGLFKVENVYVIADASENMENRTVTRNMSAKAIGVKFDTLTNLKNSLETTLGENSAWNIEKLVAGETPTKINCVAASKLKQYVVNHYLALNDASVKTNLSGYTLYKAENFSAVQGTQTSAEAIEVFGFEADTIQQVTVASDNSTVVNVFYERDMLIETFEQYPVPINYDATYAEPWNWTDAILSYKGSPLVYIRPCEAVPQIVTKDSVHTDMMNKLNPNVNEEPYEGERAMRLSMDTNAMEIRYYLNDTQKAALAAGGTLSFAIKMTGYGSGAGTFLINGARDWTSWEENNFLKYDYETYGFDVWQNNFSKFWGGVNVGQGSYADMLNKGYIEIAYAFASGNGRRSGYCVWLDNIIVTPKNA